MRITAILLSTFFLPALCLGQEQASNYINTEGKTVETRFNTPKNFKRTAANPDSFAYYLRNLSLKPHGSKVKYHDGRIKSNLNVYLAVLDMEIGKRDLEQCADAVMRLRGEYLYGQKKYDAIHFNFLSDGKPRYYKNYAKGDYSYKKFKKYMNYIFAYANTASLHNELVEVEDIKNIKIGDVFIRKGRPYGHAVIVVDLAKHNTTGKTIFLLAQSYMPAQETQILMNPNNTKLSPWYKTTEGLLRTPEWQFDASDLRRFR